MRLGMRWRIALPYMLVVLVVTAALGLYLSQGLRRALMDGYRSRLLAEASLVSLFLSEGASAPDPQYVADRWTDRLDSRLTIIARNGVVLADSHSNPQAMDNHLDRPEVQQALSDGVGTSERRSDTTGHTMLYLALVPAGTDASLPIIRVSVSLQEIDSGIARMQRTLMATALGISAVVMALSFVLADRITRPLRRLTDRVLHSRLPTEGVQTDSYDEVESLAGAFGQMTSELSQRLDALAEERNKVSLVLAHLNDGVMITDSDGVIRLISPAAVRLLDLGRESGLVGRSLTEAVANENVLEVWRLCHETGTEHETMIEMPNRGAFLRLVASPISGSPLSGEMLLIQDLTQVRRLESVRRDFISNISHELRTPLASLKALVDTLQDGALEDPAAAPNFLQRMEIEVDSLTQMVQELLELSRIESGQVPIRLAPVPVAELLTRPLERLRPQVERADLELAVNVVPDSLTVLADQERTRQVVTNIVHNAIKFTPPGGRISVSAIRAGDEVVIAVADTGIGIPEKDLPRIFERFYKADRARVSGGTGLGLAIAKHIVQAHGGRIWVKSQEGAGSIFYFTLPAA